MKPASKIKRFINDYLVLRKVEQEAFYLLALLILLLFLLGMCMPRWVQDEPQDLAAFDVLVEDIRIRDSLKMNNTPIAQTYRFQNFDPNTVTIETLMDMGIKASRAKSIVNYKKIIKRYNRPEQLLECYGVDTLFFEEIRPFVVIAPKKGRVVVGYQLSPFDPNTVTREALMAMNLPTRFINQFLNYRNAGAQFYSIADMQKIYALDDQLLSEIRGFLRFPPKPNRNRPKAQAPPVVYFKFNPNTISKDSIILLGVPSRVAQTWINFRNAGATFHGYEDMKKIIGLRADKLNELLPWMQFPASAIADRPIKKEKYIQPSLGIDLNTTDRAELEKIYGVGKHYANAIMWYRESAGGFFRVDQLSEIEYLPDSVYQSIRHHFVQPSIEHIQKTNINTVSRRTLADHPYCNYEYADEIISIRELNGPYTSWASFEKFKFIPEDEYVFLKPYLTHE